METAYIGILYMDGKYEILTLDKCNISVTRSKIENGSPVFDIFDKCYVKSNIRKFLYGNTTPNRTDYKTKEDFEKKFLEFIKETIG